MTFRTVKYMWILIILYGIDLVYAEGVGKVFIGVLDVNSTNPDKYSFSANEASGTIPVYLLINNETTGEPDTTIPYENDVNVTCEIKPVRHGYSSVTFTSQVIKKEAPEIKNSTVAFSITASGRTTDLTCWGESIGFVPVDLGNGTFSKAQFSRDTSLSPVKQFQVRKGGTVNLCSELIIVPNYKQDNIIGQFVLELSEAVEDNIVDVNCAVTSLPTPAPNDVPMRLNITDQVFGIGSKEVTVTYELEQKGSPVSVQCTAQSRNGGRQFISSNSAGSAGMFVMDVGYVRILPTLTGIKDIRMQMFLVLDKPLEEEATDVTFSCNIVVPNNTAQALEVARNPSCEVLVVARPPPIPLNTNNSSNVTSPTTATMTTTLDSTSAATSVDTVTIGNISTTSDSSAFNMTTESPVPSPSPSSSPGNYTGEWTLDKTSVIFQAKEKQYYKMLLMQRTSVPVEPMREIVLVTCCAPADNNVHPKYLNASAAMLAVAHLEPSRPINWTAASETDKREVESALPNPAYVEVSQCPCDLTANACDTDCCCDKDCSSGELATFNCIPGIQGGFKQTPQHQCSSEHFNKEDWFPFLCVHSKNSAFLGYYFQPEGAVRKAPDYNTKAAANRPDFSYRETEKRNIEEELYAYRKGISVKTGIPPVQDQPWRLGANYRLTLPQKTLRGECVRTAPIVYLENVDNDCVRHVTQTLCDKNSVLSARTYAEATTMTHPPCPRSPLVMSRDGAEPVATTHTNFYCASDVSSYLRSTETVKDLFPVNQQSLFSYELDQNATGCTFDTKTKAYRCPNDTSPFPPPFQLPPRCSWDDGFTRPPIPQFNVATNTCTNAVLKVHYNFTWAGTTLLLLNASFVMGDLPMELVKRINKTIIYKDENGTDVVNTTQVSQTYPAMLSQNFQVDFTHQLVNSTKNTTDNETVQSTERYDRSGKPGYEFTKPVLSGVDITNDTTNILEYINFNLTNRLSTWKPGESGLCKTASRTQLLFGMDATSSCTLRLTLDDLKNCNYLRKLVLNRQDNLMPANYISKGGDPNRTKETDWIKILRQDISGIIVNNSDVTTSSPLSTVPMTTGSNNVTNTPVDGEPYSRQIIGRCVDIPSGIHVDVFYTESGLTQAHPIYEVTGTRIGYTLSTWELLCSGANSAACYGNTSWLYDLVPGQKQLVRTFVVSSSVSFIRVPPQTAQDVSQYEEKENQKKLFGMCYQETCWEELLYPFLWRYTGDPHMYNVAMGLISFFAIIGLFMITRPWW